MPASRPNSTLELSSAIDGLLVAPVSGRGPWRALRDLHNAMKELRRDGRAPKLSFVQTIASDGRLVGGRHPDAATFVMGYRLGDSA